MHSSSTTVRTFKDRGVALVIHAGDIVSPPALKPFEGMRIAGIFGNNDGEQAGLSYMRIRAL